MKQLLAGGAAEDDVYGVHTESLGVTTVQRPHPPILVGGHGRRVLELAAREAQIVQLTGLEHAADGTITPGGFPQATIEERVAWLREVAGARFDELELSALVQRTVVGDGAAAEVDELAERFGFTAEDLQGSPFVLLGTVDDIVEKLLGLRERLGISYVTVREADAFAPVLARLRHLTDHTGPSQRADHGDAGWSHRAGHTGLVTPGRSHRRRPRASTPAPSSRTSAR